MANLIAKLGLDSKEFKAGLNSAKAATGGFQGTIKGATNGMREMFDVALKPIAVMTAAIFAVQRAVGALNEVLTASADNMRAITGGNLEVGVTSQGEAAKETARQFRILTDEQTAYAESEGKTLKAAEESAKALLKLQKAQALLADEKTGGKNREAITRDFANQESRMAASVKQYGIGIDVRKTEDELAAKKSRAEELRKEAQDAEALAGEALREASRLTKETNEYVNDFMSPESAGKRVATGVGSVFAGDIYQKELDKRQAAMKQAQTAAKNAVEKSKAMNDEALKLERDYTYGSIALKELRTKAETEAINSIAEQLDKNASRLNALNAVQGRGVEADSMARVGGFLGGERPGLAVADKQLQVAKETLTIQKENKVLLEQIANATARANGGTGDGI
jgi:hypothetical protein